MATIKYNKDKDYKSLIDEAVKSNDYETAAFYEQQRNDKIAGEGLSEQYSPTYEYISPTSESNIYDGAVSSSITKGGDNLTYENAPSYISQYSTEIDNLIASLTGSTFNDFLETDDYQALAKQYTDNADLASEDVMGNYASMTGGLPSSYATTAAQQTSNAYLAELDSAARNLYSDQQSSMYDKLNLLTGLDDIQYSRAADEYAAQEQARLNQLSLDTDIANTMAGIGDFSALKELGYTDEQIAQLTAYYNQPATTSGSGSTSSSSNDNILSAMLALNTEAEAYDYLVSTGLSQTEIDNYLAYYKSGDYSTGTPTYGNNYGGSGDQISLANAALTINGLLQTNGGDVTAAAQEIARMLNSGLISYNTAQELSRRIGG